MTSRRQERSGSSPDVIPRVLMDSDDLTASSVNLHVAVAMHKERKRIVDRVVKECQEHGNTWLPVERIIKIVSDNG